jgi:AraC-like DNA-binding protein
MRVEADAAEPLAKYCRYFGFREETAAPLRRREGPGADIVVLVSFGERWWIDGEPMLSFAAGLHERQVTTEHAGRSFAIQLNIAPPIARALLGVPLHTLANAVVPLDDVLGDRDLAERVHDAGDWPARFRALDDALLRQLAGAREPDPEVIWAWRAIAATHGNVRVATLSAELGWSRKKVAARFREHVGMTPKAFARLVRFEHARKLAMSAARPDWGRLAVECGYYDQSHLINEFRAVTGRTPETFFQDPLGAAA